MHIGVDASNIRSGGGVTHLTQLLRAANPDSHGFSKLSVWSGTATLRHLEDRPWLVKSVPPQLDLGLLSRIIWQRFRLSRLAEAAECDVLFVPGGTFAGDFRPMVTMSRNMLPFDYREMLRYGVSWMTLKLALLRVAQTATYRKADGVIFLTRHAYRSVTRATGPLQGKSTMIPHGVDQRFVSVPRLQRPLECYSDANPFRLIYVSTVDVYKHQWSVAEAVARLRQRGLPIAIDLVGAGYGPSLVKLRNLLKRIDPGQEFIRYQGIVAYEEMHRLYEAADMCVFASSCENMPNILIEGMASGLPAACSSHEPMPEVLGDAGVYFKPEDVGSISEAIYRLVTSPELRMEKAKAAFERATIYSWEKCANETFSFLSAVARQPSDTANFAPTAGILP